jgi:iron complex outermembrane receptor protein
MKLYGACIDKMDPASSYVEMENLEAIEVSTGGSDLSKASQIGGHINFVTSKPKLSQQPSLNIQTENGFESNALLRRTRNSVDYASTFWGFRGSYSYRGASDFSDGSGNTINRSGFEKRNYKAAVSAKWNNHLVTASFLGDDAWNVGFPVLLMDATLAQSRLYSLEHVYNSSKQKVSLSQRFYGNTVDHWMDDRHRDVASRSVMNNMFMPMFGNTRTVGYLADFSKEVQTHQFSATLDMHQTSMFGDMYMYSLFPNIPDMYLINVGNAMSFNSAVTGSWKAILSSKFTTGISIRFDYSNRDVQDPTMQQLFQRTWNLNSTQTTYLLPNSSVFLEYRNHYNHILKLEFSANQRLPTTVENYGHYVYNYVDGFFYTGNPSLLPEQAYQTGFRYSILENMWQLDFSGFYSELRNIITGIQADDSNLGAISGGSYQFRVYSNAQSGFKYGGETAISAQFSSMWLFRTSLSYVYGHNRSFNEPLPMLPPLTGSVVLRFTKGNHLAEIDTKWTIAQNRIARFAAIEDATDGWNVVNVRIQTNIKNRFVLKAGIENVFNRFYIDHLSFGNLPSQGRNLYLSLNYTFSTMS